MENGGVAFLERLWLFFGGLVGFGGLFWVNELQLILWRLLMLLCRTVNVRSRQLHFYFYKSQVEDGQPVTMLKRKHLKRRKANMAVPT